MTSVYLILYLGSAPGEVDIVTNKYMGLSDFAYLTNLTLLHGKAYYATVKGKLYLWISIIVNNAVNNA